MNVATDSDRTARYRGCLLGLAIGDALGTTLEFRRPGTFEPITDMVGGGPFRLAAGEWTDDTSMALCIAESLVVHDGQWAPADVMDRFSRWWREGYWSVTGQCFDIGNTVRSALARYLQNPANPYAGSDDPRTAGNGSLMRLAPVPMAYAADPECMVEIAKLSSALTHGATTCIDACAYFGGLIAAALNGASKDEICGPLFSPAGRWPEDALCDEVRAVALGSYKEKSPPEIRGTGYVVDALEAALWAFYNSSDFAEGALAAVNLGDDADTTGAIYGQLAGAFYGEAALPDKWKARLAMRTRIEAFASELAVLGNGCSEASVGVVG